MGIFIQRSLFKSPYVKSEILIKVLIKFLVINGTNNLFQKDFSTCISTLHQFFQKEVLKRDKFYMAIKVIILMVLFYF